MSNAARKKVLCPLKNEKTGKTYWMRLGSAFENRDGSYNVYLDAYPANGRLQIRDLDERDFQSKSSDASDEDSPLPF